MWLELSDSTTHDQARRLRELMRQAKWVECRECGERFRYCDLEVEHVVATCPASLDGMEPEDTAFKCPSCGAIDSMADVEH